MQLARKDLDAAVVRSVITAPQADALWQFLLERPAGEAGDAQPRKLTGVNVAYYFGALLVIGAMGWLMTLGFEAMGGGGMCVIALAYAALFILAARSLFPDAATRTPGGLLYTMAVCMTPLAVFGFERATGLWADTDPGNYRDFFPWIKSSWFFMEACTVVAALFALRRIRFSFLVAPVAVALWFMSMDLAALLASSGSYSFDLARRVSLAFGLGMVLVAFLADRRTAEDYSYWLYLFGVATLWGALSSMDSGSELNRFLYALLNCGFIVAGAVLRRRVFIVFGALGANGYLAYLAYRVFEHSMLFPFVLTLFGIGIIAVAVQYQKHHVAIEARIASWVPESLRALLPAARLEP